MAALKRADVDLQWHKLSVADKVNATRVIPLASHTAQQLTSLPRANEFEFASKGKTDRITDAPRQPCQSLAKRRNRWHD